MRPVIDIDGALVVVGQRVGVESDGALGLRIDLAPDAQVAETAKPVIRRVRPALVFLHHRNPVGIVAIGLQPGGLVDR
jgi:hypothetical protein